MLMSVASHAESAHEDKGLDYTLLIFRKEYAALTYVENGGTCQSLSSQVKKIHCVEMDSSETPTTSPADCMDLDEVSVPVSMEIFEPIRRLDCFAPPKRFYRTFWRSMAGRILELSSTHMIVERSGNQGGVSK
jgi:hypothetical protein